MLKINHILQTNVFHHIKRNSAVEKEQDLLTTWVCSCQLMFCVCWDVIQFYILWSLLSTAVASVFTSFRAFCKVCSAHSSPRMLQAACVFWKQAEYHGPTKHSTVMTEVLLEIFLLIKLKLNHNIWLALSPPFNYINTFGIFLVFLISKHKFQWQTTMNRGLSYLKYESTPLVWKKYPLPLVMADTNKVQKVFVLLR